MLQTAGEFAAEHLGETNAAEMFLAQHPEPDEAREEVAGLFAEAAPDLSPDRKAVRPEELCVLATPADPAGDRFRDLACRALPHVEWHTAPGGDDVLVYREFSGLPLAELPQLGPVAFDAYLQMAGAEHFTPHCRTDVDFTK
jgi:hypothetical protein